MDILDHCFKTLTQLYKTTVHSFEVSKHKALL